MTGEMMSLKGLVEKTPDADGLREMISFAASRLMEQEVSALTGARYGEKDPERRAKAATVTATVPGRHALAPLSCASPNCGWAAISPASSNRAAWLRLALTAVIQEAYIQGISTRSVDDLVKTPGMTGISRSQVSRLCEDIDGKVILVTVALCLRPKAPRGSRAHHAQCPRPCRQKLPARGLRLYRSPPFAQRELRSCERSAWAPTQWPNAKHSAAVLK
jgi:hypothetical protein